MATFSLVYFCREYEYTIQLPALGWSRACEQTCHSPRAPFGAFHHAR